MSPSVGQESLRQPSDLSLADSHFCPSETTGDETYQDVVESLNTRSFSNLEVEDRSEKMLKKKHHSDPGADNNSVDFPELFASCRSEPELLEPEEEISGSNKDEEDAPKPLSERNKKSTSIVRRQQIRVPSVTPMAERMRSQESIVKDSDPFSVRQTHGSPHQQRRYFKKRLRGPYGEMLEEEMRKSGEKPKPSYAQELDFLQELCENKSTEELQQQPSGVSESSNSESRATRSRPLLRSSSHSLDETHLQRSELDGATPRRKISANIPLEKESENSSLKSPVVISTSSEPSLLPCERTSEAFSASEEWSIGGAVTTAPSLASQQDTRAHIIGELFDTEKSYVESLQILVNKYMKPLKTSEYSNLVDSGVVDEIFYKIPDILQHHETFLEALRHRLATWDSKRTVGDVCAEVFTKQSVIDTYTAFIHNWKSAKDAIKTSTQAKPTFAKFLEHMSREHKGKLTLDALLIMPVQRIPRYELLIKELLKHTHVDHPDHNLLVQAQKEVHDLAVSINHVEREVVQQEQMLLKMKEIEHIIEGVGELIHPDRIFIRHDLVTIPGGLGIKKDRCLFLFSDLLLITSIKRRSAAIRKSSSVANSPSPFGSLETNKYKLLMRLSLENLEILKTTTDDRNVRKILKEIETLEDDVAVLGKIADMLSSLSCNHQVLEEAVREVLGGVSKQLIDRQTSNTHLLILELAVTINEGVEDLTVIFPTPERRLTWESAFIEAKEKLALHSNRCHPPDFLYPLPIRKTRAGLQITCAAPTLGLNHYGLRDVWVCNSDGYVGQVCILSMQPEPTVTSCNGVSNARILCITSVPAILGPNSKSRLASSALNSFSEMRGGGTKNVLEENINQKAKNGSFQLDSESSDEDEDSLEIVDDEFKFRRSSLPREDDSDNRQPTMWLGTEDGCIYVYNCNDNIRIKKTKIRIQHPAAIYSIIPMDNRVFVSLANGELVIYSKDSSGGWDTNNPQRLLVGSMSSPYTRMIVVAGKLWCGSSNSITTLNPSTLEIEHAFQVTTDNTRPILNMVLTGMGVWVSLQNSAVIRLFHATTHENLLDVNITPPVTKMLSACDDIIRQHKSACLRVTALLACKDLLWVGTSAGVLLTLPLPHITATTTQVDTVPNVTGIAHGHTGHVRFLTSVEMTTATVQDTSVNPRYSSRSLRMKEGHSKWPSSNTTKLLVISGGDGYEDFSNMGLSEAAGRDDSTNHLLLWKV